ncbi:uncharacterized protein MONBRDRAFT_8665 [Monosiga brevicollis MX1]|uniref:Uncharacterized protein n=1 Tax=Monosiga brevicollis TaxID=81824 RepID=A9V0R5_MONBE|nr:uncharacterized protein MONBRDRAFT_8665 [Monosiga brevicollis MX1]EDQ88681.1 predicted protein [Monosiga brevicollis MX1]|eukprot:XP_001746294.1 hypothetical protein [Monosiga brevicollis MX1]
MPPLGHSTQRWAAPAQLARVAAVLLLVLPGTQAVRPTISTDQGIVDMTAPTRIQTTLRDGTKPLQLEDAAITLEAPSIDMTTITTTLDSATLALAVDNGQETASLTYASHADTHSQATMNLETTGEARMQANSITLQATSASASSEALRVTGGQVGLIADNLHIVGESPRIIRASNSIALSDMGENAGLHVNSEQVGVRASNVAINAATTLELQGQKAELRTSDAARAVTVASDGIQITSTGDVLLQGALNTLNVTHLAVLLRSMRADVDALKQQLNATRDQLTQRAAQTQSSSNNIEALMSSISSLLGTEDTHLSTEINQLNSQLTAAEQAQTLVVNNADANLDQELSGLESRAAQVSRAFPSLEDAIDTAFDSVEAEYDRIGDVLDDRVDSVADIIDDLERDLEDRLDDVADEAVDVREDVADAIEDVKDDAQEFSEDLGQAQQDLASAVGDMVGDLSSAAADRAEVSAEVSTSYRSAQVASANVADSASDTGALKQAIANLDIPDAAMVARLRLRGKQVLSDVNGTKELVMMAANQNNAMTSRVPNWEMETSDLFGAGCDFNGTTLACGAPNYGTYGSVLVYTVDLEKMTATLVQTIAQPTNILTVYTTSNYFGWSVALSANFLAVGAPLLEASSSYSNSGGVFLFRRNSVSNLFEAVAGYQLSSTSHACGRSLALGEYSLSSAVIQMACSGSTPYLRSVRYSGSSIMTLYSTLSTGSAGSSYYGYYDRQMDSASNYVIVGDTYYSSYSGRASVYLRASTSSTSVLTYLYPATSQSSQYCGFSAATDGDYFVFGCPYYDTTFSQEGLVVIYKRTGSSFSRTQVLRSALPTYVANMYYGMTVSVNGGKIFVAAPGELANLGQVYRYGLNGGSTFELERVFTGALPSEYLGYHTLIGFPSGDGFFAGYYSFNSSRGIVSMYNNIQLF